MDQPRETPLFFDNGGKRLYGMIHTPAVGGISSKCPGVVCCAPFDDEAEISQKVRVNFARHMATRGYWVLRFDYSGCGDSEGDFEDATLDSRVADIRAAVAFLKQHTEGGISLFGLRLGATLALLASAGEKEIEALVLWEPIQDLKRHLGNFIRTQVMAMNGLAGRVVETRQRLVQRIEAGKTVDILAYPLSPRCYQSFLHCDLESAVDANRLPRLVTAIGPTRRQRKDLTLFMGADDTPREEWVHFLQVEDKPFWVDPNDYMRELRFWQGHENLFAQTTAWLDRHAERGGVR